jgi:hypothetical protein
MHRTEIRSLGRRRAPLRKAETVVLTYSTQSSADRLSLIRAQQKLRTREERMDMLPKRAREQRVQKMIDEMVAAEQRHLAQRTSDEIDCECRDGMFPTRVPASRRTFLFAAGSTTGAAAVAALSGTTLAQQAPPGAQHFDVPPDPTKEQGRPVAGDGGYGSRSQFETEVRTRFPTPNENTSWSFTPLQNMVGNLTASGLHFERHHGGIPTIDPSKHLLIVHGDGRHAEEVHDGGLEALPFRHAQILHRVLR